MIRRKLTLAVAALAVLVSGCALPGPRALDAAVPDHFAEAPAPAPAAAPEPDLADWWKGFNDQVLDDLVARTLADNLDLRQTAARIEQARQQAIMTGARGLPQLQADAGASRTRISEHAIPVPPGQSTGGRPSPFGLPGSEFNSYHLGVDASWQVDLFGGIRSAAQGARARTQAAQWSRRDLQVSLAAETASHYLALRALQQREAIAWDELSRQREVLSIVRARAGAGLVTGLDVEQQQALVNAAEARTYPLEAQARAEIHALGVLAGEAPDALAERLARVQALPAAPPMPAAGLPSSLLRRRPDIRRAEREVAAAAADVGVAAADLYPQLTLSAQPDFVSTALSSLLDWSSRSYTLSAGVLWPIFEGGRLKAALARADAAQTEALLAYRKTVLVGLRDVEDALARCQADEAARGSLQASLDQARGAEALARDQQRAGLTNFVGVLTAQQAVTGGEDQLAQAELARAQDVVSLYRALGGGWDGREFEEKTP